MDLYTTGCTVDLGMQKAQHLSSDSEGPPRLLWASPDTVRLPGCFSTGPETPRGQAKQAQDQASLVLATGTDPWAPKQPLALTIWKGASSEAAKGVCLIAVCPNPTLLAMLDPIDRPSDVNDPSIQGLVQRKGLAGAGREDTHWTQLPIGKVERDHICA